MKSANEMTDLELEGFAAGLGKGRPVVVLTPGSTIEKQTSRKPVRKPVKKPKPPTPMDASTVWKL